MKAIRTRQHKAPAFAVDIWAMNGGAALAVEAAPTNLASVPAARILKIRPKLGCVALHGSWLFARAIIYDGTTGQTLVTQGWFFDDSLGIWIQNSTALTLTVGAANVANTIPAVVGSKFYFQVVSNAAGATALGCGVF